MDAYHSSHNQVVSLTNSPTFQSLFIQPFYAAPLIGFQSTMLLSISFILFLLNSQPCYGEANEEIKLLLSFATSVADQSRSLSDWDGHDPDFCTWNGIMCLDGLPRVSKIELSGKNITGELPAAVFELGYIEEIDLSDNKLYGRIPQEVFACSLLRHLNLSNNNLTGPVPYGYAPGLGTLDLSNNMLSGPIPAGIGMFYGLKFLDLGGNVLVGEIPDSISNVTGLEMLTLASNQLTGPIPSGIGHLKSLKWMYLGYNNLSGKIPAGIGELTSLAHLDLVYNNLTGEIPSSLGNLSNLEYMFLYQNGLSGPIPDSILGLRRLVSLDLSENALTGEIPEQIVRMESLEILHLFSNKLTGKIPDALSSLPKLQVLQLWSNNLTGPIPSHLGLVGNLTLVDLSTNFLTGMIPETLCRSGSLSKLILFSNSLEGQLPKSLGYCKSLRRVRLQNNLLSGELPFGFTRLTLVYYLDMSGNDLSGRIGEREWDMPLLQMLNFARNHFSGSLPGRFGRNGRLENLDLSENGFSGTVPRSLGMLSELVRLKLSNNELSGNIPSELSSCKKLVTLDLSKNRLTGLIPGSLSEMPILGDLNLSENDLSGEIPAELGKAESLIQVNISHNKLNGRLPTTATFLAINGSSVIGNDLCGGSSSSGLPPCGKSSKYFTWVSITCSLGAIILLAPACLGVLTLIRRKTAPEVIERTETSDETTWELQFFDSKFSRSATLADILAVAVEKNVVSQRKTGISYAGKLNGAKTIKFFLMELSNLASMIDNSPSLGSQLAEHAKLRHPNIVRLLGSCLSKRNGFLIYEHVNEGRKLNEILHGLSWDRRAKIAIGIAKAIKFLHGRRSRCIALGDLSSRKILVDKRDEPHLRLKIPGFVCLDPKTFVSSGYFAPEVGEGRDIREMSDIQGFGLILIEMVTGKTPVDPEFGVPESIVEWARYCYSDRHLDTWIDPTIRGSYKLDDGDRMVETMNLALRCTAMDVAARPCASHVVKTLASVLRTGSCICPTLVV